MRRLTSALITRTHRVLYIRNISRGFNFRETSHVRSFVKRKSSRNATITLSFTDICKSCPICEFLASQMCLLTLIAKIKFSRKFPDLQYMCRWRLRSKVRTLALLYSLAWMLKEAFAHMRQELKSVLLLKKSLPSPLKSGN